MFFFLQISSDVAYFFLSCPKHCDRGLIVVIVYYFQIWNKKEHNIISGRIITSCVGPIYNTTLYTTEYWIVKNGISINQLITDAKETTIL